MAFIALAQIEKLLPKGVATQLAKEGVFAPFEKLASTIVTDRTGRSVPDTVVADDDWVITPMAWIIKKLAGGLTSESNSAEYISQVKEDWKAAMEILDMHKETPSVTTNNFSKTGAIEGELIW